MTIILNEQSIIIVLIHSNDIILLSSIIKQIINKNYNWASFVNFNSELYTVVS